MNVVKRLILVVLGFCFFFGKKFKLKYEFVLIFNFILCSVLF